MPAWGACVRSKDERRPLLRRQTARNICERSLGNRLRTAREVVVSRPPISQMVVHPLEERFWENQLADSVVKNL